jgi:probable HAF family extracellular repeat protein
MRQLLRHSVLAVVFFSFLTITSAWCQKYSATDIGTLGGDTAANAINNLGQVTGYSTLPGRGIHAILWSNGTLVDLGTLGGPDALGYGINDQGDVVGYSELADGSYRGFAYTGGRMISLPPLSNNYGTAYAINNHRQIIGDSRAANGIPAGFVLAQHVLTDIGNLGGVNGSSADGINNLGQIVGYSYNSEGNFRAFLWQSGSMLDLGTLGGDWSEADDINDSGQITGNAYLSGNFGPHAFVIRNGAMTDIDNRSNLLSSSGLAINRTGIIVGKMQVPGGQFVTYHAMVVANGKMKDLNTLIAPDSGWTLQEAHGISDAGQIVGVGLLNNQIRGFLLTPLH